MSIEPTNRSAAIAGIWSSLGLAPFEGWIEYSSLLLDEIQARLAEPGFSTLRSVKNIGS
jgi:hypothetical protein